MFKSGFDRNQLALFPTSLDDMIDSDNIVRVVDAFVDSLDLVPFHFKYSSPSSKGNKPYNPKDLLKLALFGYVKKVRSSRSLMYFSRTNIECIWLIHGLTPDFRTISDFRKDNSKNLKSIFYEFNLSIKELGFLSSNQSQDGSKIKACNSKEKNFTLNKLDDRIKMIQQHIQDYLEIVDLNDKIEDSYEYMSDLDKAKTIMNEIDDVFLNSSSINKEEYISELKNYIKKLENYQGIQHSLIESGNSQISLTDKDSRLMRNNGKFDVCLNNQVLVDENHFVDEFLVTNSPADLGTITEVASSAKNVYNFDTIIDTTDKGYNKREDMMNALENGVIPQVTPMDKQQKEYLLETPYEENKITDEMIQSTNPKDIKKCLRAGVVPSVYKNHISSIEVKEKTIVEYESENINEDASEDELRDQAINNHCFTRHTKSDKVFCPMGEILRKKSVNQYGTRYCNKLACKNCKNPCCSSQYRTVDFKPGKNIVFTKQENTKIPRRKAKKKKIVKIVSLSLKIDFELIKKRMTLSELPHAMLKRWRDASYLLLKGKEKATGECAIYYCAENILHAKNLIGVDKLIEYFKNKKENLLKMTEY